MTEVQIEDFDPDNEEHARLIEIPVTTETEPEDEADGS